ncbi:MAG: hypothetical protein NUV58_02105 [Candidatus Roizmanbacteria bacterium]|nr:hypothetical protein [Candidatus Roizmanbacteria bacterium]
MVSKSKILGKPPLILISVGSTKFPFFRLFSALEKVDKNKYKIIRKFLPTGQFIERIKKAKKIIVHAGPATIFLIVKNAKCMPLIIPRQAKFNEHVDDHQMFFCKYLRDIVPEYLKKYFVTEENIKNTIYRYIKEKNEINNLNKYLFLNKNTDKLFKNLDAYTNKK